MHTTSCFMWLSLYTRTCNGEDVGDGFGSVHVLSDVVRYEEWKCGKDVKCEKRRSNVPSVIEHSLQYLNHHPHRKLCFHYKAWDHEELHLALPLHQNVPPPFPVPMAMSHRLHVTRYTSTTLPFPQLSPSSFFSISSQSCTSSLRSSIERASARWLSWAQPGN